MYIIVFIAVVLIVLAILAGNQKTEHTPQITTSTIPTSNLPQDRKTEMIKRQMEILYESIDLVNTSNNLETVLRRYDTVCNTVDKLISYPNEELEDAGYFIEEPLSKAKSRIQGHYAVIVNQAIERNMHHEINSLQTAKGKLRRLDTIYSKIKGNGRVTGESLVFLENLYNAMKTELEPQTSDNTEPSAAQPYSGGTPIYFDRRQLTDRFYALSRQIESEKDIHLKLKACEESYKLLPQIVQFELEENDDLSSFICCDLGPELYMRLGEWENAEKAIDTCIAANAYYPDSGEYALEDLRNYKRVAEQILEFLQMNPGFLQKDIYKAMAFNPDDKDIAMHFLRYSMQIEKEPYNKTYQLYIKGAPHTKVPARPKRQGQQTQTV